MTRKMKLTNSDGTNATIEKIFQIAFEVFDLLEVFRGLGTCSDLFTPIWMRLDASRCVQKRSEVFASVPTFPEMFDFFEDVRSFFEDFWTLWNVSGRFRTCPDVFGSIWTLLDMLGCWARLCQIPTKPGTKCAPPPRPKSAKSALSKQKTTTSPVNIIIVIPCEKNQTDNTQWRWPLRKSSTMGDHRCLSSTIFDERRQSCLDVFGVGCVRIHLDMFGRVGMLVAKYKSKPVTKCAPPPRPKSPKCVPSKQKTTTGFAGKRI